MLCFSLDKFNNASTITEETEDWFTHEIIILKRKYIANLLDQISWGSETRGQRKLPSLSGEQSGASTSVKVMRDNIARMKRIWATLDYKIKPMMDRLGDQMHELNSSNQKDMEHIIRLVQRVAERSLPENRLSLLALVRDISELSSLGSSGQEETRRILEDKLMDVIAFILKAIKKLELTANRIGKQQERNGKDQRTNRKRKSKGDVNLKEKKTRRH